MNVAWISSCVDACLEQFCAFFFVMQILFLTTIVSTHKPTYHNTMIPALVNAKQRDTKETWTLLTF